MANNLISIHEIVKKIKRFVRGSARESVPECVWVYFVLKKKFLLASINERR